MSTFSNKSNLLKKNKINFNLFKNFFNKIFSNKSSFQTFKNLSTSEDSNKMTSTKPPIIINPSGAHKSTLIFFHGYGDTGTGWADNFENLRIENLKVVCPTANRLKSTLNNCLEIPSWFDILALDDKAAEDVDGIHKANKYVHELIEKEIDSNITSEKIFLGGFSQGGALALYSGLTYSKKLAGLIIFSSWIPLRNEFPAKASACNQNIKILQCHGDIDFIVPFNWGQATNSFLKQKLNNENITFKVYNGLSHSGCSEENKDTKEFIEKLISEF